MKRGKILYVRGSFAPINFSSYNVQEIGLLKGFCNLGFDCDFIYLTNKTMPSWEYTVSNHVLRVIPMHGIRVLRTRINFNILKSEFLDQYDLIISAEYGQIMTYLLSKVSDKVIMYSGPYYNLFKIPFVSLVYDFLFTKAINKNCKGKFVKNLY